MTRFSPCERRCFKSCGEMRDFSSSRKNRPATTFSKKVPNGVSRKRGKHAERHNACQAEMQFRRQRRANQNEWETGKWQPQALCQHHEEDERIPAMSQKLDHADLS